MSKVKKPKPYDNDKYIKLWLNGLSERTQQNYSEQFAEWYSFVGMTPTQMIEKRLKDLRSDSMAERLFFEQKFREYRVYLEKRARLARIPRHPPCFLSGNKVSANVFY